MSDEQRGIVIPGRGLYLPNEGLVEPKTAKERKQLANAEAFMNSYPTRRELQGVLAEAVNVSCNNLLDFFISNFELTPKTDEGKRVLELHKKRQEEQEQEDANCAKGVNEGEVGQARSSLILTSDGSGS